MLGVAVGLFFGEPAARIGFVGDAFILLLQMTVLPYVAVSLVLGLGSLTPPDARLLALRAGTFLLVLWGLVLLLVPLTPLAFPDWPSASFFSSALIEAPRTLDLVGLYVPANPFRALADNVVPSVVLFSTALGLAVMGVERKRSLLDALRVVADGLMRIATFVVELAPFGVFAIAAKAAGTMDPAQFRGLQIYLLIFGSLSLVLGLWAIPVLVTSLTPLRYRDIVLRTRGALVTAFATGSVFVVLPLLASRSKELLGSEGVAPGDSDRFVDVVVPVSFTFPPVGKLLRLVFVLFAGWISGFPVAPSGWGELLVTGPFVLFAHTFVAIPFLLDLFRIPSDTFQLLVVADSVLGDRFSAFLGATHVLALATLSGCALAGTVRVNWRKLAVWGTVTLGLSLGALGTIGFVFSSMNPPQDTYRLFLERGLLLTPPPTQERNVSPETTPSTRSRLDQIHRRGVLRVGYRPDSLPYIFRNDAGELVGLDVDLAGELARDLGVSLDLVRFPSPEALRDGLMRGAVDVGLAGLPVEPNALRDAAFSDAYIDETLAFIVPDHLRDDFSSAERIQRMEGLRIAVPAETPYYADGLRAALPRAEIIEIDSLRPFFRNELPDVDALLMTAESGSSWCLIYPAFSVAVPHPVVVGVPIAIAMARGDPSLQLFLDHWIALKRREGTLDRLFDYWIRGRTPPEIAPPRWSVIRDVLGWVD